MFVFCWPKHLAPAVSSGGRLARVAAAFASAAVAALALTCDRHGLATAPSRVSLWRGSATPARSGDGGEQGFATVELGWVAARRRSSVERHGSLAGSLVRHRGCLAGGAAIRGPRGACCSHGRAASAELSWRRGLRVNSTKALGFFRKKIEKRIIWTMHEPDLMARRSKRGHALRPPFVAEIV